jgi:hypothetical protein
MQLSMQNQPQLKLRHWDKSTNILKYGIVWGRRYRMLGQYVN